MHAYSFHIVKLPYFSKMTNTSTQTHVTYLFYCSVQKSVQCLVSEYLKFTTWLVLMTSFTGAERA